MSVDALKPKVDARPEQDQQQQADAKRYAELMDTIAWLDALPDTPISDVVAAQRSRLSEKLREIALRRLTPRKPEGPVGE
jgi:hypothetical protein